MGDWFTKILDALRGAHVRAADLSYICRYQSRPSPFGVRAAQGIEAKKKAAPRGTWRGLATSITSEGGQP